MGLTFSSDRSRLAVVSMVDGESRLWIGPRGSCLASISLLLLTVQSSAPSARPRTSPARACSAYTSMANRFPLPDSWRAHRYSAIPSRAPRRLYRRSRHGCRYHRNRYERGRPTTLHSPRGCQHLRRVQSRRAPRIVFLDRKAWARRRPVHRSHCATLAREEDFIRSGRVAAVGETVDVIPIADS